MKNLRLSNCNEVKAFLEADSSLVFEFEDKSEKYRFIDRTLRELGYWKLSKKDKGLVRRYLMLITGLKKSRVITLTKKARKQTLKPKEYQRTTFSKKYTDHDIALLAHTDEVHLRLNAGATKEILIREYRVFGKVGYKNISNISVSHIYNLRKKPLYKVEYRGLDYTKTNPTKVSIGERRKPRPEGRPGYIRVDSVHQGDRDKEKGVYHINSIDEVLQWEILGSTEGISEQFLLPLLEIMIAAYPFKIVEFHADNGSEYINHLVTKLLNKLLIKLTKSRPRRSNDNAQVEGKNGSIIRKHMGRAYIPRNYAREINQLYIQYFNPYLNYHRPCGYATITIADKHGKEKKKYDHYMTPYDKLKSLSKAEQYLKEGITFAELDKIAYAMSDNEAAVQMENAKDKLFEMIKRKENI